MTNIVTCPACGKRLYEVPEPELALLNSRFAHTCGYKGKLAWDREHGTQPQRKSAK